MLNLERKKLEVKFEGQAIALSFPTIGQLENMHKAMAKDDGKSEFEHMKDFMVNCGLRPELFDQLEPSHVNELVEHLTGQKKA